MEQVEHNIDVVLDYFYLAKESFDYHEELVQLVIRTSRRSSRRLCSYQGIGVPKNAESDNLASLALRPSSDRARTLRPPRFANTGLGCSGVRLACQTPLRACIGEICRPKDPLGGGSRQVGVFSIVAPITSVLRCLWPVRDERYRRAESDRLLTESLSYAREDCRTKTIRPAAVVGERDFSPRTPVVNPCSCYSAPRQPESCRLDYSGIQSGIYLHGGRTRTRKPVT